MEITSKPRRLNFLSDICSTLDEDLNMKELDYTVQFFTGYTTEYC